MNTDKAVFTRHALERGRAIGLSERKLRNLLGSAERRKDSFWRSAYKLVKYGNRQGDVAYYYRKGSLKYPLLLFTVEDGEEPVVITVTRKKGRV